MSRSQASTCECAALKMVEASHNTASVCDYQSLCITEFHLCTYEKCQRFCESILPSYDHQTLNFDYQLMAKYLHTITVQALVTGHSELSA